jgi:hypothetical protein
MDTLSSALEELEMVETALHVIAVLSMRQEFGEYVGIVKLLLKLLKSAECMELEMNYLLSIISNISRQYSLIDVYPHLLQAAEAKKSYSSTALRILCHQKLPSPGTRYALRLIVIVTDFLEDDKVLNNMAGVEMAAKIARRKSYSKWATGKPFCEALEQIALRTESEEVFCGILDVLKAIGQDIGGKIRTAAAKFEQNKKIRGIL